MEYTSLPGAPRAQGGPGEAWAGSAWEMTPEGAGRGAARGPLRNPVTWRVGRVVTAVVSLSLPSKIKWENKKSRRK